MAGKHLREPLDYLYEELPPEDMAEARRHLAECPECRTQMRSIRETVKLYRKGDHPIAPIGLSARTIQNALDIARGREAPDIRNTAPEIPAEIAQEPSIPRETAVAPPAPPPPPERVVPVPAVPDDEAAATPAPQPRPRETVSLAERSDAEFARLKEEVLGEIRRNDWRSWLFHPAWTVAASVIFLCALLIHLSPHMQRQETIHIPAAAPSRDGSALQLRDRERLPASQPAPEPGLPPAEAAPILQEAAVLNEPPDLPVQPVTRPALRAMPMRAAPASAPLKAALPAAESVADTGSDDALPAAATPDTADVQPPAAPAATPMIVVVDGLSPDDVPQIVQRPTPIDVDERIRSLTTLIGMQIASGEFDDAVQSLSILERYNKDVADELRGFLARVPRETSVAADSAFGETTHPVEELAAYDAEAVEEPRTDEKDAAVSTLAPVPVEPEVKEEKSEVKPEAELDPAPSVPSPAPSPAPPAAVFEPVIPPAGDTPVESPVSSSASSSLDPYLDRSPLGHIEPPEDPPLVPVPPTNIIRPDNLFRPLAPPVASPGQPLPSTPQSAAVIPPPVHTAEKIVVTEDMLVPAHPLPESVAPVSVVAKTDETPDVSRRAAAVRALQNTMAALEKTQGRVVERQSLPANPDAYQLYYVYPNEETKGRASGPASPSRREPEPYLKDY